MKKAAAEERRLYGWHLLAKDVSDFINLDFMKTMELPAMEFFSLVMVINAKNRISSVSN